VLGALVPPDVDNVAIALGGDHAGVGTIVGEQGVGGNGGPVEHMLNVGVVGLGHLAEGLDALNHADGGIVDGGRHFVNPGLLLGHICQNQVGEGGRQCPRR
jgi:hypothetical protein